MSKICSQEELLQRWHAQIGDRRPYRRRRPLAAMGYLCRGKDEDSALVELGRLVLVLLFDEPIGRSAPALRLVGYRGTQIAHGLEWGACCFYKDLRIEPSYGGSGLQLDSSNVELLQLALQLRSELYRCDCFSPKAARRAPQLPKVWAGFTPSDAESLCGDGPELLALCQKFDLSTKAMLRIFQRDHEGLVCFPVEWLSSELRRSLVLFADVEGMPRQQVFQLPSFPEGLLGFEKAMAYDFFNSRQRDSYTRRLEHSRRKVLASA